MYVGQECVRCVYGVSRFSASSCRGTLYALQRQVCALQIKELPLKSLQRVVRCRSFNVRHGCDSVIALFRRPGASLFRLKNSHTGFSILAGICIITLRGIYLIA